jgi:hypothetical protein
LLHVESIITKGTVIIKWTYNQYGDASCISLYSIAPPVQMEPTTLNRSVDAKAWSLGDILGVEVGFMTSQSIGLNVGLIQRPTRRLDGTS